MTVSLKKRLAISALFALCAAGLVTASLLAQQSRRATVPGGSGETSIRSVTLSGEVHDLAYDAGRDHLWLAAFGETTDELVAIDTRTGSAQAWGLPATEYNGYLSQVRVAPDGAVWVAYEYTIVRFDPGSEDLAAVTLAHEDEDAAADALSEASALPGTWITALGTLHDGSAVIARNNVSSLQVFDAGLHLTARVDVPAAYSGASRLVASDSTLYLSTSYRLGSGPIGVLDLETGAVRDVTLDASDFDVAGDELTVLGGSDTGAVVRTADLEVTTHALIDLGPESYAVLDNEGGFLLFDDVDSSIKHIKDSDIISSVTLPESKGTVMSPAMKPVQVSIRPRVDAMAYDDAGRGWYVLGGRFELLNVRL